MENALKYKFAFICILSTALGYFLGERKILQTIQNMPPRATRGSIFARQEHLHVDVIKDGTPRVPKNLSAVDQTRSAGGRQDWPHEDISNIGVSGIEEYSTSTTASGKQGHPQSQWKVSNNGASRESESFTTNDQIQSISNKQQQRPESHAQNRPAEIKIGSDRTCSQESRVSLYKSVCVKRNPEETVRALYLDYDNKLAGCISKKAGSICWLGFLHRNKVPDISGGGGVFYSEEVMSANGFGRAKNISSTAVQDKYGDWVKYLTVRHPLQRLVSGYYQHQRSKRTFLEFVRGVVSGDLMNVNSNWMEYNFRCRVCHIDYQFIVKQETIDHDIEIFKELYGFRNDLYVHVGSGNRQFAFNYSETPRSFKYDEMLGNFQDEHPELMRGLLKQYRFDMELFGYGWDWDKRESYCGDSVESGCC